MIILILFGLLQALILPGLVASYYLKNIDVVSRIISPTAHREAETAKAHRG